MPYHLIIGLLVCLLGVMISLAVAIWSGPWHAARVEGQVAALKQNVTSLLEELTSLSAVVAKADVDAVSERIARAQTQSAEVQGQLGGIGGRIQSLPQSVPGSPFGGGGFSWDKQGTLASLANLQNALADINRQTSDASASLNRLSLALLDVNRRITDLDARISGELKKMEEHVASFSKPQKLIVSVWVPFLVALAAIVGGVSTIWLGWRKDRREVEELRLKYKTTPPSSLASAPGLSNDAQQPLPGDAPRAARP
ncbi:MAG: hypothetical protein V9G63_10720 [Candidatus Competibacter sp.]